MTFKTGTVFKVTDHRFGDYLSTWIVIKVDKNDSLFAICWNQNKKRPDIQKMKPSVLQQQFEDDCFEILFK